MHRYDKWTSADDHCNRQKRRHFACPHACARIYDGVSLIGAGDSLYEVQETYRTSPGTEISEVYGQWNRCNLIEPGPMS